jgi:hypothetical protein
LGGFDAWGKSAHFGFLASNGSDQKGGGRHEFRCPAREWASDLGDFVAPLKRCPDTKLRYTKIWLAQLEGFWQWIAASSK